MASEGHKQAILASKATDIFFTASIDGAPANFIAQSLIDAGIDLNLLRTTLPGKIVSGDETRKRWKDIWTAGHGVGNIDSVLGTAELCRRLKAEYRAAAASLPARLAAIADQQDRITERGMARELIFTPMPLDDKSPRGPPRREKEIR